MYTFPPIAAAIGIAYTIVAALTAAFTPLIGASAAAVAVVCLTVIVRLLVLPLSYAQVRGEKARSRLFPKLQELQKRHAKNPERLRTEMTKLYADEGTSPLAGCLPMLAQAPVFAVLYGLFVTAEVAGAPNALLTHTLGGVPLGWTLGDALAVGGPGAWVFAALLTLIAAVAWASRRWLTLPALAQNAVADRPAAPGMSVMSYLPFATVLFAAFVPLAAGLYLATSAAWTVAERTALRHVIGM
ncbi:YidC/Oxa1 family membrane protein insertase [Spinactinospora alkalitolerans]|uniref:Membrane protein insertase YidC n=1 Tax=Spinactinospora alkalitolerans TaxID=687207 RepID=A0A852TSU8_9ACTN|nr:YidC/Oxa1 family membrane protein insertase [Spinactinospora alkalitolerans]NYE45040.1 YidC/Oxa1 family membrane protein insertase [Spinactinospora alkalitolerans]